jgi:hypothetical protein
MDKNSCYIEAENKTKIEEVVNEECRHAWRIPRNCMWLIVMVITIYYSLFILDIYIDSDEASSKDSSLGLFLSILSWPFILYSGYRGVKYVYFDKKDTNTTNTTITKHDDHDDASVTTNNPVLLVDPVSRVEIELEKLV